MLTRGRPFLLVLTAPPRAYRKDYKLGFKVSLRELVTKTAYFISTNGSNQPLFILIPLTPPREKLAVPRHIGHLAYVSDVPLKGLLALPSFFDRK